MNDVFVLILVAIVGHKSPTHSLNRGVGMTSVEFSSKESCETAAKEVVAKFSGNVDAICVRK